MMILSHRSILAPREGEGGETSAEDPVGSPARPAEEPQGGRNSYKGTLNVKCFQNTRYSCAILMRASTVHVVMLPRV